MIAIVCASFQGHLLFAVTVLVCVEDINAKQTRHNAKLPKGLAGAHSAHHYCPHHHHYHDYQHHQVINSAGRRRWRRVRHRYDHRFIINSIKLFTHRI